MLRILLSSALIGGIAGCRFAMRSRTDRLLRTIRTLWVVSSVWIISTAFLIAFILA